MNSSQLTENCGAIGSTKGYFIIDINNKKYPVCQPASLESVALGKTADGNLTVLGSQLSVQLPKETTKFEDTNSTECSNGAVKVTSFIDYNLNNLLDMNMSSENNSSKSYTFCKMGITVQPTAPKLNSILLADNNLSIDFNFSIPMNPATINPTTAFIECNDSRIFSYIDFNYSNSSPKAFSLFYDLEAGDYSCKFSVLKYVEDLNGTKMKDNNFTEINLSIPVL